MKSILIIEDDRDLANLMYEALKPPHYHVTMADSGSEGLRLFTENLPDLLLLDLTLPDIDGTEICRTIRKTDEKTPIFIVSARVEEVDRILGLELGADDYITKPFSVRELRARVDTFFRRWEKRKSQGSSVAGDTIIHGSLRIDKTNELVALNGRTVVITGKEFHILELLAESPDKVFTRKMIIDAVWGTDWEGSERMVDTCVRRIRDKLVSAGGHPRWIRTVWGSGYKFQYTEPLPVR